MAEIIFLKDDPERFYRLLEGQDFPRLDVLSLRFLARYHAAYFGPDCIDLTFAVAEQNKARIVVPCQMLSRHLKYNGTYILIHSVPDAATRQKTQLAIDTLLSLSQEHSIETISVRTGLEDSVLDLFGDRLLKAGASPVPLFASIIDLTQPEPVIRQGIRKSYSSLIHWGEKSLRLTVIDRANPDRALYEEIRAFHAHVAGRVTRSKESWDTHFDMIAAGCAEMLCGHLDGQLVSAALYMDEGKTTIYGVGIYERSLFDKPLAHFLTWQGMMRAKARGQMIFNAGDVYPKGSVDDKQYHIGDFKKGFSPAPRIDLGWTLICNTAGQPE